MTFPVTFSERTNVPLTFTNKKNFSFDFGSSGGGYTSNDHNKLKNRDLDDQHPMSAITGLLAALNNKLNITDEIVIYCGDSVELVS